MSSHLHHSDPATVMSLEDVPSLLESDPFSPLTDVSLNTIFQEVQQQTIPAPITQSTGFLNPKSEPLEPPTHFPSLSNGYVAGDVSGVRQLQRSFSCGAPFYGNPWFCFQPSHPGSPASPAFLGSDQFRRAYSTGDIQRGSVSRFPLVNVANIRTERCSAEEKKEKIAKYRAKRGLRNFGKTIKYVCRKTLADRRQRVRGRFARNDEVGGMPGSAAHANGHDHLGEKQDD